MYGYEIALENQLGGLLKMQKGKQKQSAESIANDCVQAIYSDYIVLQYIG